MLYSSGLQINKYLREDYNRMKKLIEKYWEDMYIGVTTQNKEKILQHFAQNAAYKFRPADGMVDVLVAQMAESCLGYKDTLDCKYSIERIDELANGSWMSLITCSVSKKPYFITSFFRFGGDKIIDLVEYYGDF